MLITWLSRSVRCAERSSRRGKHGKRVLECAWYNMSRRIIGRSTFYGVEFRVVGDSSRSIPSKRASSICAARAAHLFFSVVAAPLRPINESAATTINRYSRTVDTSETTAGEGGYGGHPTEASTHSNERTGHSEDNSEFVGGSSPVQGIDACSGSRGLRNFPRLEKGGLNLFLNGGMYVDGPTFFSVSTEPHHSGPMLSRTYFIGFF